MANDPHHEDNQIIHFHEVSKSYRTRRGTRRVLDNVSFDLEPGHNYGILGANGAGKSTLLRLIAGSEPASSGHILRRAQVSYPLGFTGTFNGYLTGRQNIKFMARVYRRNVRSVLDFVWDFAELGGYFDMPVNTYSSGMIGRLSMGVSFAIDFDVYLVDEITAVGDARFRQKCSKAFQDRAQISDIIMVSHSSGTIKNYCDRIAILRNGQLELYSSVNEAMKEYARHMSTRSD